MRAALALILTATLAQAAPPSQLSSSVERRLDVYGVHVDGERLTTAQAAALHLLLVSERGLLNVRRKARAILRNPDFRD